jgi:hypothetical protein
MRVHPIRRPSRHRAMSAVQNDDGTWSDDNDSRGSGSPTSRMAPPMAAAMGCMGCSMPMAGYSGPSSVLHPMHMGLLVADNIDDGTYQGLGQVSVATQPPGSSIAELEAQWAFQRAAAQAQRTGRRVHRRDMGLLLPDDIANLDESYQGFGQGGLLSTVTGAIQSAGSTVSSAVSTAEGAAQTGVSTANSITGSAQSTLNTVTGAGSTPGATGTSSSLLPIGAGILGLFLVWKLVL